MLEELIAENCIVEGTSPAPNGKRLVGREACLKNWKQLASNTKTHFVM